MKSHDTGGRGESGVAIRDSQSVVENPLKAVSPAVESARIPEQRGSQAVQDQLKDIRRSLRRLDRGKHNVKKDRNKYIVSLFSK